MSSVLRTEFPDRQNRQCESVACCMAQALLVDESPRAPFSEPVFMDPEAGIAGLPFTYIVTMKLRLRTLELVLNVDRHKWKDCILRNFASF